MLLTSFYMTHAVCVALAYFLINPAFALGWWIGTAAQVAVRTWQINKEKVDKHEDSV